MELTIGKALQFSALGIAIVFCLIIFLMIIVKIISSVVQRVEHFAQNRAMSDAEQGDGNAPAQENASFPAPGSAGEVKLYQVSDRDAAMIMAIVSDKLQLPLNELHFISIKEIGESEEIRQHVR